MNAKNLNSLIIIAILLTLLALVAQQYFPRKSLLLIPNNNSKVYLYSTNLPDGTPAVSWLNESIRQWRCVYPERNANVFTACSFIILLHTGAGVGIDLSAYTQLKVSLKYRGSSKNIRLHIRNYDPKYSTLEDENSTKFNAVNLQVADLETELTLNMREFIVSDWWLRDYDIPRSDSLPDFSNSVTFGIDFADTLDAGKHDITVEKIELSGSWISAEHWYLTILGSWLLVLFSIALTRLIQLHRQTRNDLQIINELNQNNAQLKQETAKFRRLSTVDPLTQTYNRFGIDQIVSSFLLGKVNSTDRPPLPDFALMVIDIDHFKRVNDRRGHDAGDRVLQQVAAIIQKNIRTNDYLGRWGGEEFVVLLPNTRKEFAIALAEKIRLLLSDAVFEPTQPLSVTASFGVGDRMQDEDFASTFKRVDTALYKAKENGRNCCVLAEDNLAL